MKFIFTFATLLLILAADGQGNKIRIFLDCNNSYCDDIFFRQQIPVADFVRDRQESDVHVLIIDQRAGNGGRRYNLIFLGQHAFSNIQDTLNFTADPAATESEIRNTMLQVLKTGINVFLVKNGQTGILKLEYNSDSTAKAVATKDKWNYWVFSVGSYVTLSGDKNYSEKNVSLDFSANRVTEKLRMGISAYGFNSNNRYSYIDNGNSVDLKTRNKYFEVRQHYVRAINSKWSWAIQSEFNSSTYDNTRSGVSAAGGIEFNLYPYSSSSTKFLAIRVMAEAEHRNYREETVYNKTAETLFSQDAAIIASFTQPWGSIQGQLSWYHYLHDFSKNNLAGYINFDIRLFKGFSVNFYGQGSLINDQLSLPKQGASQEEVLLRLKQLATTYNYRTGIGINYRFGSQLNNFINPRFTDGRY